MSTKQLKKKLQEVEAKNPESEKKEEEQKEVEESDEEEESVRPNLFSLLQEEDDEIEVVEEETNKTTTAADEKINQSTNKKRKKKRKKTKNTKKTVENGISEDNFEQILHEFGAKEDLSPSVDQPSTVQFLAESELFRVDYRNFNPDTEMRRLLGAKFKMSDMGPSQGRRKVKTGAGGKLVQTKTSWPIIKQTGLSMKLVDTLSGGIKMFAFEHGAIYQTAQNLFWNAVESMNPDAFIHILQEYPYHIDTLLQLSEVVRVNEDYQMSRDLVDRALYACECAFHPLFSVVQYGDRLDYSQWENRIFYIALFRHMIGLCRRGCYKTALEFAKLIFGLDPVQDPLGMLLMIDFLAIKARQFDWLVTLYHGLEPLRNVSQLPNFSFSTALALYLKWHENEEQDPSLLQQADSMLQEALIKFPTLLMPILDKCSVEPDKEVNACSAFGPQEQFQDSSGLKQLNAIYISRCHELWKEQHVLSWLEQNVRNILPQLSDKNPTTKFVQFKRIRRTRFQGTPRNILRHVLICELGGDAMMNVPAEIREASFMSYDPLPPLDSRSGYERPARSRLLPNDGFFTGFLRSLMPNYNPEEAAAAAAEAEEEGAVGGEGRPAFQQSVRQLLNAMRELLNDVEMVPPERGEADHQEPDPEWD